MSRIRSKFVTRTAIALVGLALVTSAVYAATKLMFNTEQVLSVTPTVGMDGDGAFKGKLVYLEYETAPSSGIYEKVLISVYADSPNPGNEVWDYNGEMRPARDIFVTRSTDHGTTWSQPVNITNFTDLFSATADPDGVGPLGQTTYWATATSQR